MYVCVCMSEPRGGFCGICGCEVSRSQVVAEGRRQRQVPAEGLPEDLHRRRERPGGLSMCLS